MASGGNITAEQLAQARRMLGDGKSLDTVAGALGVSRGELDRALWSNVGRK